MNVTLPLMLLKRPDPACVQAMLDAVGLGELGHRLPQQLSGGQLQRVAMASALVAQTREHGASLVLVTHTMPAALQADGLSDFSAQDS